MKYTTTHMEMSVLFTLKKQPYFIDINYTHNYTHINKPESSYIQQERHEQAITVPENSTSNTFSCNTPTNPQKLECPITTPVSDLCQSSSGIVSCCTVHSDDTPVSSGNQCICTYIDTMTSIKYHAVGSHFTCR